MKLKYKLTISIVAIILLAMGVYAELMDDGTTCNFSMDSFLTECTDGTYYTSIQDARIAHNIQPTPTPIPTPTPNPTTLILDSNPQTLSIGTETITLSAETTTTLTVDNDKVNSSWIYVSVPGDFTTSGLISVPVTGLYFTPVNNTKYEVEVDFMVRSPELAIVGARPGITFPAGLIDGTAFIQAPSLQTTVVSNCNIELPCISPGGGLTTTTGSYGGFIKSTFVTGQNVSGNFQVTLASETEGVNVSIMNGSFLKYKVVV